MSVMAALCVNVVTVNMLLSVFFLSGVWTDCRQTSGLLITAPKKMEALSGSCLIIPCNYREKPGNEIDSSRETFGVWIKNEPYTLLIKNNAVFNSSGSVNIYPMNIIGDLSQKNCTTLFYNLKTSHSDTYYFRIENWSFKATADCDPLQITVKDSPWRPRINISGDLKEKESVTITCSAFTPCPHSPPQLTWNLQQDPHNKIEENTDGTFTTKIQETITLSDTHDGYNISCSVRYPVNEGKDVKTAETQETLSVSYAPKDTSASISPSGLVSAGIWVNLTCSSRAKPPIRRFTWFKNSKDGPMNVSEGHFYSFNVTDGGVYYCVASNQLGNQTSPWIHLIVEESSQTSVTESHLTVEESSQTSVTESHLTVEESYQTSVTEIHLDVEEFGVDVHVTVKILGITILYSTIIIFECWFRSRCSNKPHKDTEEEEDSYFNRVVEIQAS